MSRPASELAHLFRALRRRAAAPGAPQARERARQSTGASSDSPRRCSRPKSTAATATAAKAASRPPVRARKTLEESDFTSQTSLRRGPSCTSASSTSSPARENVVLLGPPGTGKRSSRSPWDPRLPGPAPRRVPHRHRMGRAARRRPAQGAWMTSSPACSGSPADRGRSRLHPVRPAGREPDAILVSRRYERASMIVTSDKTFSAWGRFRRRRRRRRDDRPARPPRRVLALKGDSYRLKDRNLTQPPAAEAPKPPDRSVAHLAHKPALRLYAPRHSADASETSSNPTLSRATAKSRASSRRPSVPLKR